jgi:hypothetical protein
LGNVLLQQVQNSVKERFRKMSDDAAVFEIVTLRQIVDVQFVEDDPLTD